MNNIYAAHKDYFEAQISRAIEAARLAGAEANTEAANPSRRQSPNGVAIVPIVGPLQKRSDLFSRMFGGSSYIDIRMQIESAMQNKGISEIMLVVDSPGGDVDGVDELADYIRERPKSTNKPITAFVDGMAASAGYWLASQASMVYASKTSEVGSIGVYSYGYDFSKAFEKDGVEAVVATTGALKGAGIPGTEITPEQREETQKQVDGYFKFFKDAVAKGRNIDMATVGTLATGGMYFAQDARTSGLINGIATYQEVLSGLANSARSKETARAHVRSYYMKKGIERLSV